VHLSWRCIIVWRPEPPLFYILQWLLEVVLTLLRTFYNPVEYRAGTALSDGFSREGSFLFPIPLDWYRFSTRNVAGILPWADRQCRKCVTTMVYRGVAKIGSFPKTIWKYLGIFMIRLIPYLSLAVLCRRTLRITWIQWTKKEQNTVK